jgi:microsomal epoxide hydrolase
MKGNAVNPEPFEIRVTDDALDDLRRRVATTRWPPVTPGMGWNYGFDDAYLQKLARTWNDSYDWRAAEAEMNSYAHYRVTVDDIPIHYIREPGKGPRPIPLILTHGYPMTFWDMRKVIRPLADPVAYGGDPEDAFDVIVPSLPGFCFSSPLPRTGLSSHAIADLWHKFMTETLGYEKYAAAGVDTGARVTEQLGHKYASSLYGIHTVGVIPVDTYNAERYWDFTSLVVPPSAPEETRRMLLPNLARRGVPHVALNSIEPHTMTYAMNDSPVGMLAWIMQRRFLWADLQNEDLETAFTIEHMLTTGSLYWFSDSITSSPRIYAESARNPWAPSHERIPRIEAPIGVTLMGGEPFFPRKGSTVEMVEAFRASPVAKHYNLHFVRAHEHGGHFAHYENPQACIDDIRATFRDLR